MAIIRHSTCDNTPQEVLDYLVRADTDPIEAYLIDGINTTPYDIAGHYYMDNLQHLGHTIGEHCAYHHYIISFDPRDREHGLTMQEAHKYGLVIARKFFGGHRVIVCTHNSEHIHTHIIVLALRCLDIHPDPSYMRSDANGNVYESEYRAGYLLHHSNRLWHIIMEHLREFCRKYGFTVAPTSAATRISSGEYYCQQAGQKQLQIDNANREKYGIPLTKTEYITRNEELRRAIRDAAANSADWYSFQKRLETHYTRRVEIGPRAALIPLPEYQRMQQNFRDIDTEYRIRHNSLLEDCQEECKKKQRELNQCYADLKCARDSQIIFRELPNKKVRECQEAVEYAKQALAAAKQRKSTLLLAEKVYACYAKAASVALSHHMGQDAAHALEEMARWRQYQDGTWTEAWHLSDSASYFSRDGKLYRRISWIHTTESNLKDAERTLRCIQNDSLSIEMDYSGIKTEEHPFPISVKIEGEKIYYRHPDDEHWIGGYSLGDDFTLAAIQAKIQKVPTPTNSKIIEAER